MCENSKIRRRYMHHFLLYFYTDLARTMLQTMRHRTTTKAGNKGKCYNWLIICFLEFDWGIFICSVFNIPQLFEK